MIVKPDVVDRHLSIAVAGLYGPPGETPEGAAEPAAPQLETLLARATRVQINPGDIPRTVGLRASFDELLYRLFNVPIAPDADLPIAATTRFSDCGLSDSHWWIRADPVHLEPQGNGLVLSGNESVDLSQGEAERLVAELREEFASEGWLLEALRPDRWYLRPPRPQGICTHSLDVMRGRDVANFLPAGPDAKAWHCLLNEAQILLHASPVNAEREQRGVPSVNSLWFWGGGRLPQVAASDWAQVWSDDPLGRGLARLGGAAARAQPANATRWLQAAEVPGSHLLVLDQARMVAQRADWSGWHHFIEQFEELWLGPLLTALRAREIASLTLYAENNTGMRVARRDLGRWWRRRRGVAQYRAAEWNERAHRR